MKKILWLLVLALILSGCSPKSSPKETTTSVKPLVDVEVLKEVDFDTSEARDLIRNAHISEATEKALKAFSLKTAPQVFTQSENTVYSPTSLYLALTILAEGTNEEPALKELEELLETQDISGVGKDLLEGLTINTTVAKSLPSNALWVRKDDKVNQEVADTLAQDYKAAIFNVDFGNKEDLKAMSQWVKDHTQGLIEPHLEYDPLTLYAIFNTIYFKDAFNNAFFEGATDKQSFTKLDGTKEEITFFHGKERTSYQSTERFELAEKSLSNLGSLIIVKPNKDDPKTLINQDDLTEILYGSKDRLEVNWSLPEFDVSSQSDLRKSLEAMGIKEIFNRCGGKMLEDSPEAQVDMINQEARIKINETGVEAAAFTEIAVNETAMPMEKEKPVNFVVDRPFLVIIRDHLNTPLFIATVYEPMQK